MSAAIRRSAAAGPCDITISTSSANLFLSDRKKFAELVNIVMTQNVAAAERRIAALIEKDQEALPGRSAALLEDL